MTERSLIYADLDRLKRLRYQNQALSLSRLRPANSHFAGKHVSKLKGRGLNFEELRHYHPGDDIRSMDWKVTRRTGKPHVKVYTEERERNVYLTIDQRQLMFFGSTGVTKSLMAAELAASLAWLVASAGDRVGAVIYNDNEVKVFTAKRGQNHIMSILKEVVKFNNDLRAGGVPSRDDKVLVKVLSKLTNLVSHDALCVCIGDNEFWRQTSIDMVKRLRRHNEIIICDVFDPLERRLPMMSNMQISDGHHQIQVTTKNNELRHQYQTEVDTHLANLYQRWQKLAIPVLSFNCQKDYEPQLQSQLG